MCHHVSVCVGVVQVQLGRAGERVLCGAWAKPEEGCRVHQRGLGRIEEGRGCVGEGHGHVGKGHGCIGEGHGFVGKGRGQSEGVRCVGGLHVYGVGHGLGGACGRHRAEKTATPAHLCLAVTPLAISMASESHPASSSK